MFRFALFSCTVLSLIGSPAAIAGPQAVQAPPLTADGATSATLHLVAPPGLRIRGRATIGEIGEIEPVDGGYRIAYLPPAVDQPLRTHLSLRLRGGDINQEITIPVDLVPSWDGPVSLFSDPEPLAPGRGITVKARVLPAPTTTAPSLVGAVSEGTLGQLVASQDGSSLARYTAPARRGEPGYAVAVVTDRAAPAQRAAAQVIPLSTTRPLTLSGPPGHNATLQIGDRSYGPSPVTATGEVTFKVDLHPDHVRGELSFSGPKPSSETRDLPVTPTGGVVIGHLPASAPAGTTLTVPIGCVTPTGSWCAASDIEIAPSEGELGPITERGGLFFAPWTLPDGGNPSLTVTSGPSTDSKRVRITPGAVQLTLSSEPDRLDSDVTDLTLQARSATPSGDPITGRLPTFQVHGARLIRRATDKGEGLSAATYRLDSGARQLQAIAHAPLRPTADPPQRLLSWPVAPDLPADGSGTATVVAVALDAYGIPVPDVPLEVEVLTGDATVGENVRTDRSGLGQIQVRSGRTPGLITLKVQGAGLTDIVHLWQSSPELPAPALPPTGSADRLQALSDLRSTVATLLIREDGSSTAPTAAPAPSVQTRRATATSTSPALARLRAGVANAPFSYRARVDGEEAGLYAPTSSFSTSPVLGQTLLHLDGELWPDADRVIGIDARLRAGLYRITVGGNGKTVAPTEAELGARYRFRGQGALSGYAGLGVARTQGLIIRYGDETRSTATFDPFGVVGARVGGGVRYSTGPLLIEVDLQSLWIPAPAAVRLEARGDVPVSDPLALTFGLGGDARHLRHHAADVDARLRTTQLALEARLGVAVRFD